MGNNNGYIFLSVCVLRICAVCTHALVCKFRIFLLNSDNLIFYATLLIFKFLLKAFAGRTEICRVQPLGIVHPLLLYVVD